MGWLILAALLYMYVAFRCQTPDKDMSFLDRREALDNSEKEEPED